ncbi:MAG TPA: carboxypeptidase-like regulatory domain-containing protein [Acidobacteriaceae bacterium]|nr:carboxypeptidase-like regulatory domain-containing protein [Acidobacteriaceae bacterium]
MDLSRLRCILSSLLLVFLLAFATLPASAIDVNGRIKGTVTDPSGAVLPGVQVTATNSATGVKFETKTLSDGNYLFPQLPVGTYSISVSAQGFKAFTITGIIINIDQEYVQPVKLEVGNRTETLEVAADAVQVNTTDMQLGNIVDSSQMVELPLINRNFTGLELIEPGVQASSDRFGTYSASGSQTQQSEFVVNGADTNDLALNTLTYTPNLDAINQFNLLEGPLNAEYDRNSGGIVSATIKQGTNHFHGDAFEFYRDTFLNTASFFQYSPSTGLKTVSKYHQNVFGGTLGGPIFRDKLFFFGAYQGTRQVVPEAGGTGIYVPDANNLGGNFSEFLKSSSNQFNYSFSTAKVPATITGIPGCPPGSVWSVCLGAAGTNGVVPTSAFNPISVAMIKAYVPSPNSGTYGYNFNPVVTTKADQEMGRIDFALNPTNQFTFVGVYQHQVAPETLPFTGATVPGFGDVSTQYTQQYTFDYVHQFNASTVNEFQVHWTRFNYQAVFPQNPVSPSSAGFQISPQNTAAEGLPLMSVSGFFTLGFSTNGPQPRIDQVYQLGDSVSKVIGNHSFKFGYDGRRFNVSNPFSARNNGSYSFTSTSTYSTGVPILDFLLGIPASYSQSSGATIQADAFLNYLFAQDTWKVSDSLTFDYGMGYSLDTPLREHQYQGKAVICLIGGQQSTVFPTAPKGLNYPGDPGCSTSATATMHYGEFGPRIGFAWSPTSLGWLSGGAHRFSIRGGFGIYYDRTEEESSLETLTTPPFGLTSTGVNDYSTTTTGTLVPEFGNPYVDINSGTVYANKFPYTFPTPGAPINWAKLEPVSKSTYAPNFRAPYAENFQLSLEREFPAKVVARLSYVGSLAHRNQVDYEGNYETAAGHAACLANPACSAPSANPYVVNTNANNQMKLYPGNTAWGSVDPNTGLTGFTSIGEDASEGSSNYNALQASVQKAYTHGLQFQLSYTFSHALDDGSSFENSGFGSSGRGYNQYDKALNYGNSSYDARQRLVFAPIYISPILHGSSWYSPKNLALSGWEITGIMTLATGFPYDISYAGGSSNSLWCSSSNSFYACPDVPNQVGPLVRLNPRVRVGANDVPSQTATATGWFAYNTGFVTPEAIGTFGNEGRNAYHGPGINNTNLIIARNFNMSSDGLRRLRLSMESDNVFNHTNFANPSATPTFNSSGTPTGTFGQITSTNSAYPARQTQLAAKFYF